MANFEIQKTGRWTSAIPYSGRGKAVEGEAVEVTYDDTTITIIQPATGKPVAVYDVDGAEMADYLPLTYGNAKIDRHVAVSALMPVVTCGNCSSCSSTCYALACLVRANVRHKWALSTRLIQSPEGIGQYFAAVAYQAAVQFPRRHVSTIRLHEAGDFDSAAYAARWMDIARAFPRVRLYTYTKELHAAGGVGEAVRALAAMPNVNIVDSCMPDGHANYGPAEWLTAMSEAYSDAVVCPCGTTAGAKCGRTCTACHDHERVLFLQHGARDARPYHKQVRRAMEDLAAEVDWVLDQGI